MTTQKERDMQDFNDWSSPSTWAREFWNRPIYYPILRFYGAFMDIKRYDKMPFYFAPQGAQVVDYEDRLLNLVDWAVDAHEEARNSADTNRNFYQRSVYVLDNFLRYQNDTVCNMMYDVKAPKSAYDKVNSIISQQNKIFYGSTAALHMLTFGYLSFFFRYRRLSPVSVLLVGTGYYGFFETINNVMYKAIVDRHVINAARQMGFEE